MKARTLDPTFDREAWLSILEESSHDVYHHPAYVIADAQRLDARGVGISVEGFGAKVLWPLVLRPAVIGGETDGVGLDASSPYGYGGPIFCGRKESVPELLRGALAYSSELGICSIFCRLNPFAGVQVEDLRGAGTLDEGGGTVWCDLSQTEEELWSHTRPSTRTKINKLKRLGFLAQEDLQWTRLGEFLEIYGVTMERVGAAASYFFSDHYFESLRDDLAGVSKLLTVEIGSKLAAAGIFTERSGIVQYHLGGTNPEFLNLAPSALLFDFARQWARFRGNNILHLGGGLGGKVDSLYWFKSGFSRLSAPSFTGKFVVNESLYSENLRRWESRLPSALMNDSFFPPYRASPRPPAQTVRE